MNSTLSKSQNLVNSDSLKLLQVQLVDWAATWTKSSDMSIPSMSVDMPDIVTILQAMGYKLRKLEAHAPQDIANVFTTSSDTNTNQDRGVRIVVTCGLSGQLCVLESPLAADKCKCTKVPEDISSECFWEVTATGGKSKRESNLIESGCDALPNVSKEVNILVSNVLNYLCECISGNKELEQLEIPLKETPVSSKSIGRYSDSVAITTRRGVGNRNITPSNALEDIEKFRNAPSVAVSSPARNGTDSPTRYRSLDTLTSANVDQILPEPGHLIPKDGVEIQQSMELLSVEDPQESSTSTIGDTSFNSTNISKLKEVFKLIQNVNASLVGNNFNNIHVNKIQQIYKMIGEIYFTINDSTVNKTNLAKLKMAEKMMGDIIKQVDKNDTSKEKRKSKSASSIMQKIIRAPKLPMSGQVPSKLSNSSPNLQSNPLAKQPKQVVTIKKRNRIESSSSVLEKTELSTIKKRLIVRSNTELSTKHPIAAAAKKTLNKYANIKSTIPKPEPSKRKD